MYRMDKIGATTRIDGMIGELSYDINRAKELVETLQEEYDRAHDAAIAAMIASVNALSDLDKAKRELEVLEGIDETLRQAKDGVNQAYDAWYNWHKS